MIKSFYRNYWSPLVTFTNPFKKAIDEKNIEEVKQLLIQGHSPQFTGLCVDSAISYAAKYRNRNNILNILLEHIKKHEQPEQEKLSTALVEAYKAKNVGALLLLLRANAKVPLQYAEKGIGTTEAGMNGIGIGRYPYGKVINFGMSQLHECAHKGDLTEAKWLDATRPYTFSLVCDLGMTAAHIAAQQGKIEFLQFLAEGPKIDFSARNIISENALETAIRHNHPQAVDLLIQQVNRSPKFRYTLNRY
jgi:hypothetical protein